MQLSQQQKPTRVKMGLRPVETASHGMKFTGHEVDGFNKQERERLFPLDSKDISLHFLYTFYI